MLYTRNHTGAHTLLQNLVAVGGILYAPGGFISTSINAFPFIYGAGQLDGIPIQPLVSVFEYRTWFCDAHYHLLITVQDCLCRMQRGPAPAAGAQPYRRKAEGCGGKDSGEDGGHGHTTLMRGEYRLYLLYMNHTLFWEASYQAENPMGSFKSPATAPNNKAFEERFHQSGVVR